MEDDIDVYIQSYLLNTNFTNIYFHYYKKVDLFVDVRRALTYMHIL